MPTRQTKLRKASTRPPGAAMLEAAPVATQILIGIAVAWIVKRFKIG